MTRNWTDAHAYSVMGLFGLVLSVLVVIGVARSSRADRRMLAWFALPTLALTIVLYGVPGGFDYSTMLPLLGVAAIFAAVGLLSMSPKRRRVALVLVAVEFGSAVWGGLFSPFDISPGPLVALTAIAVTAQVAVLVALAVVLRVAASMQLPRDGMATGVS